MAGSSSNTNSRNGTSLAGIGNTSATSSAMASNSHLDANSYLSEASAAKRSRMVSDG